MSWTTEQRKGKVKITRDPPFFSGISPDETEHMERVIVKRRFRKDQIVLSEHETSNYIYFVYSGKVRVAKISDDGREQIIGMHKTGDYFGEISLLDGKSSPATVIAHEDAVIGLLHKNDFEYHLLNHEHIRRKIIDLLCLRLRDAWNMVKVLSFDSAEHRIMLTLQNLQELYGVKDNRGTIIKIKLTHQMIASYASVARETATRILKKLEKSGLITVLEDKSLLLSKAFCERLQEIENSQAEQRDSCDRLRT